MIDLSEESLEENIEISGKYLERMAKMGMTLEIELGCTGGEEDGVDNSDMDASELYTSPEDVAYAYEKLMEVRQNERLLSKAERNSLKKFSSICMFFLSCVFEGFSSIPSDFTS